MLTSFDLGSAMMRISKTLHVDRGCAKIIISIIEQSGYGKHCLGIVKKTRVF
jgi:hypothetical protein